MKRTSAICLVALFAFGATVLVHPDTAAWADPPTVRATMAEILSDEDLTHAVGGLGSLESDECVAAVLGLGTTLGSSGLMVEMA